jgi:glutamine amidotransferase
MITIINIGLSNIKSITRGFATQGYKVRVSRNPDEVRSSDSLVLPGVGAFPKAMDILHRSGLHDAIREHVSRGNPLIGICLGMQLLFTDGSEHHHTEGLGLIPGHVVRFPSDRPVPHMGWNALAQTRSCRLFRDIPDPSDFYFVHSYYAEPDETKHITGVSDHCGKFAAAVHYENIYGTQFHPEKSQTYGLMLLTNFARLTEHD